MTRLRRLKEMLRNDPLKESIILGEDIPPNRKDARLVNGEWKYGSLYKLNKPYRKDGDDVCLD